MKIYISGEFYDEAHAKISVFDHGLLYGDGIFEGIRLYEGCIFKLEEHLIRLERSAKAIRLQMPWSREEIAEATAETCRVNKLVNGYIRLVVTRGKGNLGISPKSCANPELIIIADSIKAFSEEKYINGAKLGTVPTQRQSPAVFSPSIKSLNYLSSVLVQFEVQAMGCDEGVMLNAQGYVAECSADNLFIVQDGRLYTPDHNDGALEGITRGVVMDIASDLGIEHAVKRLTRYDLWNADECFLTGTAVELVPVVEIDGRMIGKGNVGNVTTRIREVFKKKVVQEGYKI